jgi:lysophospholipase L1-like esterase
VSLKLPKPPQAYDAGDQARMRGAAERADQQNRKRREDLVLAPGQHLVFQDEHGTEQRFSGAILGGLVRSDTALQGLSPTEQANARANIAAGAGAGTPGGSDGQVQFNEAGGFGGFTLGGDAALDVTTGALTLAAVNADAGSFGDGTHAGQFTVDAKGRITAAANVAIAFPVTAFNGRTGAIALTSSDVTTALGYAPGTGSVTSVGLSAPGIFSVSGSPVTASGTLALALASQGANTVLAGPASGAAAAPGFRGLVSADLPVGSASQIGGVMVDGVTITATGGVISAVGGGTTISDTYIVGDFSKWTAAKARGASSPARFAILGDSNVAAEGAGSGASALNGAWPLGFAQSFAGLASFYSNSFFGDQNVVTSASMSLPTYDARMTTPSGWTVDTGAGNASIGGRMITAPGGTSGKLKFTPTHNLTKFRFWYPTNAGLNTAITVSIDGSLVDTFSEAASDSLTHRDYSVASGSHYIEIGVGATNTGYVVGVETFNGSSTPTFHQLGHCGMKSSDLNNTSAPWRVLSALTTLAYDYLVLYLTINDIASATALNTYYTNIQSSVAALSPTTNGCLLVCYPVNAAGSTNGYADQMAKLLRGLATDYNWSYYDLRSALGHSNTKVNALGWRWDDFHPNGSGHSEIASVLFGFLSANGL